MRMVASRQKESIAYCGLPATCFLLPAAGFWIDESLITAAAAV